jgi:hypothetical protein
MVSIRGSTTPEGRWGPGHRSVNCQIMNLGPSPRVVVAFVNRFRTYSDLSTSKTMSARIQMENDPATSGGGTDQPVPSPSKNKQRSALSVFQRQ